MHFRFHPAPQTQRMRKFSHVHVPRLNSLLPSYIAGTMNARRVNKIAAQPVMRGWTLTPIGVFKIRRHLYNYNSIHDGHCLRPYRDPRFYTISVNLLQRCGRPVVMSYANSHLSFSLRDYCRVWVINEPENQINSSVVLLTIPKHVPVTQKKKIIQSNRNRLYSNFSTIGIF